MHDSRVFRSTIGGCFDAGFRPLKDAVLIADSAYSSSDYLIPMKTMGPASTELDNKFYQGLFTYIR